MTPKQMPNPCRCKGNYTYPTVVTQRLLFVPICTEIKCMRCCSTVTAFSEDRAIDKWNKKYGR